MFAMLIFRITAALAALQVFVVVALWPDAHWLFGVLVGIVNAAAIIAVGRVVLRRPHAPPTFKDPFRPEYYLYIAAGAGLLTQFCMLIIVSLVLNQFTRSGEAPPESDAER